MKPRGGGEGWQLRVYSSSLVSGKWFALGSSGATAGVLLFVCTLQAGWAPVRVHVSVPLCTELSLDSAVPSLKEPKLGERSAISDLGPEDHLFQNFGQARSTF